MHELRLVLLFNTKLLYTFWPIPQICFEETKFVYKIPYTTLMSHCRRQFGLLKFSKCYSCWILAASRKLWLLRKWKSIMFWSVDPHRFFWWTFIFAFAIPNGFGFFVFSIELVQTEAASLRFKFTLTLVGDASIYPAGLRSVW